MNRLLVLIISLSLQTGCSLVKTRATLFGEPDINQMLTEHRYADAREAVTLLGMDTTWFKKINSQQDRFVKLQIKRAENAWRDKQYNQALSILSESIELTGQIEKLVRIQQSYSNKLEHMKLHVQGEQSLATANWIRDKLRLAEQQKKLDPENYDHYEQELLREKSQELALELHHLAEEFIIEKDFKLAKKLLLNAANFGHDPARELLSDLQRKIQARAHKRQEIKTLAREHEHKQQKQALELALQNLIEHDELEAALALNEELLKRYPEDEKTFAAARLKLDNAIAARIDALFRLGQAYYSGGAFLNALSVWNEILDLQPQNTSAYSLKERTERVIHNIEKLSHNKPIDS